MIPIVEFQNLFRVLFHVVDLFVMCLIILKVNKLSTLYKYLPYLILYGFVNDFLTLFYAAHLLSYLFLLEQK